MNTSEFSKIDKLSVVPIVKSGGSDKSCSVVFADEIPLCTGQINLTEASSRRLGGGGSGSVLINPKTDTESVCVANNSCAQNICTNVTCTDSCGNNYTGMIEPNCICAASLLSSENCSDGCSGNCTGKIEPILTNCYQESADKTSSCGGLGTGSYYSSDSWYYYPNLFDGDWKSTTLAERGYYDHYAYLYINYSKPTGSINSSLWRVKDQNAEVNLTIPQSCWNNDVTILQFRIGSKWYDRIAQVTWDCLTNSEWTTLRNPTEVANLYEEGMWWQPSELIVSQNPDTVVEPCPQVSPLPSCEEGYGRQVVGMTPDPCSHAILSDCLPI